MQLAEMATELLDRSPDILKRAGLLRGWSGVALFMIRLYEQVRDIRVKKLGHPLPPYNLIISFLASCISAYIFPSAPAPRAVT